MNKLTTQAGTSSSRPFGNPFRSAQRGVGLVEILVAVVILAVGFLAAARMQVIGMRYSQSAYFESQAYFLAGDMIARMRANVAGVKAGAYDDLSTDAEVSDPGCSSKLCTPAEIATQDQYDWGRHLKAVSDDTTFVPVLPSSNTVTATGTVTQLAGGQYSVTLVWADEHAGSSGKGTLRVDLIAED